MKLTKEKAAILLALIAPVVMIFGAPFVMNVVEPRVFGIPFNLFWHIMWLLIGPVFLTIAYVIRTRGE